MSIACPISSMDSISVGNRVYFPLEGEEEDDAAAAGYYAYHIEHKTLSVSLLAPPPKLFSPCWIFCPDDQALAVAERDYLLADSSSSSNKHQLPPFFFRGDDNTELTFLNNNEVTIWDDLPQDILKTISSYLINPFDHLTFRAVSKLCRSAAGSAPEWRSKVIESGNEYDELERSSVLSPWLMMPKSLVQGYVSCMLDPESQKVEAQFRLSLKCYSPLTKSALLLPDLPQAAEHFFILHSPTSSDCRIVGMSIELLRYYWIEAGKSEWNEDYIIREDANNDYLYAKQSNSYPVFVDGCFYFLGGDKSVLVLTLRADETNVLSVHQLASPCSDSYYRNFLVECNGDVLSVYEGNGWKWCRVFRLDHSSSAMVWEEVKDLKNYNWYLSFVSGFGKEAKRPGMGNKIYFTWFYDDSIIYFSLNTNNFYCSKGKGDESVEDSIMSYNGSKEQLHCCWFEPTPCPRPREKTYSDLPSSH
ncbi:OLC1v1022263C1 [Oldenlandia corymbosa var. corymbosa]|uniref:OLC1v1022263C1 n=1 Tax=Oldenlandia corymbosa var. corymbosa TaxID=529605 RepID=A0AAV1BXG8_OLDCO|nr:OLC1v1022263C1 [Oldenlandia corymbosa var. corymbosa]